MLSKNLIILAVWVEKNHSRFRRVDEWIALARGNLLCVGRQHVVEFSYDGPQGSIALHSAWSPDQRHQHNLGNDVQCKSMGPTPLLQNQHFGAWESGQQDLFLHSLWVILIDDKVCEPLVYSSPTLAGLYQHEMKWGLLPPNSPPTMLVLGQSMIDAGDDF